MCMRVLYVCIQMYTHTDGWRRDERGRDSARQRLLAPPLWHGPPPRRGPPLLSSLSLSLSRSLTLSPIYLMHLSIRLVGYERGTNILGGIRTRHQHPLSHLSLRHQHPLSPLPMAPTYSLSPIYKVRRCLSATNPVRLRIPCNAEITGTHSQKCAS